MNILCIIGPTASGKTTAAVELATAFGGEVVSCDSVQLYKGFDIGTAKPSMAERGGIPHHMLDVAEPEETWSAGRYAREARACISDIAARGLLPIIAGGTGFYLRALTDGLIGLAPAPGDWRFILLGICPQRDELARRIELRTSMMMDGLLEETRELLRRGVSEDCPPMGSIGYKQARAALAGLLTAEQTREEIALRTRQYAKRQRTWFFNQTKAPWIEHFTADTIKTVEKMLSL